MLSVTFIDWWMFLKEMMRVTKDLLVSIVTKNDDIMLIITQIKLLKRKKKK